MDFADSISRLIEHVGLRAYTFYAGPLCGLHDFAADEGVGHLHVIRGGELLAVQTGLRKITISEPTLLFYPRPIDHRLEIADQTSVDVLCASVRYDSGMDNAITQAFPPMLVIPFGAGPRLEATLSLLFAEAADSQAGRQAMLDRLCDVLLIQIVRYAITHGLVSHGILAGLTHPRLGKLLVALLDSPGQPWTLDTMAAHTHLSRNAFTRLFRNVADATPTDFLTQVRIAQAQRLLRQGRPLAFIAGACGYTSQPAFSRAFIRETGTSPTAWLRSQSMAR